MTHPVKDTELLYCGQPMVKIAQKKCKATLASYYNINFLMLSLNPVMLKGNLQSYSQPFFFLSYFPSSS